MVTNVQRSGELLNINLKIDPWGLRILKDQYLLFHNQKIDEWQVIHLLTGQIRPLPVPQSIEFRTYGQVTPDLTRMFDRYGSNLLRIEHLTTHEILDIQLPFTQRGDIYWSLGGNYLTTVNPDIWEVWQYDSYKGIPLHAIKLPETDNLNFVSVYPAPNEQVLAFSMVYRYIGDWEKKEYLFFYDLSEQVWLQTCYDLGLARNSISGGSYQLPYNWTPDNQLLWWLYRSEETEIRAVNITTGEYGVIAENVGQLSRIMYEEEQK